MKTFPTSFLKQLKTINYFGVDKNLIFIIGGDDIKINVRNSFRRLDILGGKPHLKESLDTSGEVIYLSS